MSKSDVTRPPRRERVERNIYSSTRVGPNGRRARVFEVGYRDSTGKQRWQRVEGGITAARAERDRLLGAKARPGARVVPNPRLRFAEAADRWLAEQVSGLRATTQANYANSVKVHLKPRWGRTRMDHITVSEVAQLVRELRADGLAESSIGTVIRHGSRVFTYARRHLSWSGDNPFSMLENGERPKPSTGRRRIFTAAELTQTLAAAHEPYRTLFAFASVTGARESECLGLVWSDLDIADPEAAEVRFTFQVDRKGQRVELKSEESRRTVELPRALVSLLLAHRARSPHSTSSAFIFSTRSGRPIGQRNALRELRGAMKRATDERDRPTFPVLHEDGPVKRGSVPHFHSFRHTAASEAIAAGDGVEEVSWQLGHKSSNVTRAVYVQEVKSAERTAHRRARMEARYGSMLGDAMAAEDRLDRPMVVGKEAEILTLPVAGTRGR